MSYDQRPRKIFLSSTCLDLIDVRAELKRELESLGYIAYTSETNDFPVNPQLSPVDNCLEVVESCDIYLLVIHSRYGGEYDGVRKLPNSPERPPGGHVSVTLAELLVARSKGLETRIWVRDAIWNSRPVFRQADSGSAKQIGLPATVEPAVYDFLDFLQNSTEAGKLWINQFHDITDLKTSVATWLKDRAFSSERQFKEEVVTLFRLLGFELNPDELLTPTVQRVLARNPDDSFDTEYAIWTHYNPSNRAASWNDLQITVLQIQNDLSLGRYEKAFLVTSGSYSPDLIDNLADRNLKRDLKLQSFNDLLGGLINFDPYLRRIVHDYENYYEYADPASDRDPIISIMRRCNLFKFFVPLRARMVMNSRRKFDGELEAYILGWLQEDGRNHLTILGDFGTGKSSFALWLTYTLAKTIIKEKWHGHRIPVFISLRDHAGKIDVREIITNTLINNYDMRHADFKSFERLLEAGRLLIILDGFDETATLTDRASTLRILRGLNSLVRRNSKVILTCRSHYFRTDEETQSELNRSLTREETELFAEQKGKENFEVVQLREFRRDQIELFLERHYDGDQEKARSTLSKMQATYNLTDLSRRPVMLEMILKVWPRLLEKSKEVEVTPALLYGEYVDAWIDKVAKGNEDLMDPSTKRAFCQDLTKWMYRENREMLPYTEIEKVVREYFKDRPPAVYAALDTEVRTCTFLNRDSVGNYQFAHRSFMEFFVAKSCAEELRTGQYDLLKLRPLSPEIANFLRGFMSDCDLLWSALNWTSTKDVDEAGYVGGNAATLLALMDQSFKGAKLERTVLLAADLTNTDISDANLSNAILHRSRLFNATLDRSDFRYADLSQINIGELGAISCLAWSQDGNYLAIGGEDFNVRLLDYTNRKFGALFRGHGKTVVDLAFIPNSNLLCSVADNLIIWDIARSAILVKISLENADRVELEGINVDVRLPFVTITGAENSFSLKLNTFKRRSFYSNVPRFSVELKGSNRIIIRDWAKAGVEVFCSEPHDGQITTACFAPTDSAIAVGTTERKAYVWDCFTGSLVSVFEGKPVSCRGMKIAGAKGLDSGGYYVENNTFEGTLAEWLIERGAYGPELSAIIKAMRALLGRLDFNRNSLDSAATTAHGFLIQLTNESVTRSVEIGNIRAIKDDLDFFEATSEVERNDVARALTLIEKGLVERIMIDFPNRSHNSTNERLDTLIEELSMAPGSYYILNKYRDLSQLIGAVRETDPKADLFVERVEHFVQQLDTLFYNNRHLIQGGLRSLSSLKEVYQERQRAKVKLVSDAKTLISSFRKSDVLKLSPLLNMTE
ncbi:MAG: DUF4062 domain-containing protein [Pyrinomonadaceae bacterium]